MNRQLDKNQELAPHVAVVGFKNSGKTTLMCKLILGLSKRGLRVGTLKHDGHDFDMDYPGTDTYQFQQAGAQSVVIQSSHKMAQIEHLQKDQEPYSVNDLIGKFRDIDVVLIEGYKYEPLPKIVVAREEGQLQGVEHLESIQAYCVDSSLLSKMHKGIEDIPVFSIDDEDSILSFVFGLVHQQREMI